MTTPLSRRRFLSITACAVATPALAAERSARWHGTALGAAAAMRLEGVDAAAAAPVFAAVEAEVARLERVFSLFRPESSLGRLNRDGFVDTPPPELLEVLGLAGSLHAATLGAFDPTVQPLWALHAEKASLGTRPNRSEIGEALSLVGWDGVRVTSGRIEFARPGMALTLNGIAQGYITDRVRAMLLGQGMRDILIDMGEIAANGRRADGRVWTAGVAAPDGALLRRVELRDRAIATSAAAGTVLDARGEVGHIVNPATGLPAARNRLVSVSAATAAVADGLSTACCLLSADDAGRAVAAFPSARLETLV